MELILLRSDHMDPTPSAVETRCHSELLVTKLGGLGGQEKSSNSGNKELAVQRLGLGGTLEVGALSAAEPLASDHDAGCPWRI